MTAMKLRRKAVFFQSMEEHLDKWDSCRICPLGDRAKTHAGYDATDPMNPVVDILCIGEGPGNGEDVLGVPFVGVSGAFLRNSFVNAGARNLNIGFANMVMCRPADATNAKIRAPSEDEMSACSDRLYELMELVQPKVILFCGSIAYTTFVNRRLPDSVVTGLHILHPAYILRQGGAGSNAYQGWMNYIKEAVALARTLKEEDS